MTTTRSDRQGDPTPPSAAAGGGGARRPGPLLTTGVPLGVSLLLHAVLLAITAAVVWRVTTTQAPPAPRVPVQISFETPGQAPELRPRVELPPQEEETDEAVTTSAPLPPPPAPRAGAPAPPDLGGLSSSGPATPAALPAPSLDSAAAPSSEALAAGASVRHDPIRFAGLGAATAKSVVYVVDGSGPMVTSLPVVLEEVVRSVSRLGPSQRFGVVIFRRVPGQAQGYEWFTPALVRATPDAIRRLEAWLARIEPRGASNPLDGLRAALEMKPEAVFLLSRSIERSGGGVWELGLTSTLAELERLNPLDRRTGTRPVVIKTIQFLDEDPSGIMQAIGRIHGGAAPGREATDSYTVIRRASDLRKANDEADHEPPIAPPN
jgi:hypothetical protein